MIIFINVFHLQKRTCFTKILQISSKLDLINDLGNEKYKLSKLNGKNIYTICLSINMQSCPKKKLSKIFQSNFLFAVKKRNMMHKGAKHFYNLF